MQQHVTRNNTFFSKKEKLERKEYVYIYLSETISILPKKNVYLRVNMHDFDYRRSSDADGMGP